MQEQSPLLSLQSVSKQYQTAEETVSILEGVDLSLAEADAVAVTGPSGSGKSTLLYMVGLLEQPTSGTILLKGQDIWTLKATEQSRVRNQQIGFIFQDHHLLPQCTVLENVLIPTLAGSSAVNPSERARELLKRVGLEHRLDHLPSRISGGERQRVAVCRALINEPEVLLADEPTGNLDQATAEGVGDLLLEVAREAGATLICVTHSMELATRFPRRLSLRERKLIELD